MPHGFTHIDADGQVRMVDVTNKADTARRAVARAVVNMRPATFEKIARGDIEKGNVIETARIAGIMAAKKTAELIPMCHPLNITHVGIDFFMDNAAHAITIQADVRLTGKTGVEMEALTAVSVSALTIYDMCKAVDKEMTISDILLVEKSGGKSGSFVRKP